MQIGMVGLGRMGANMVRRWLRGGHDCVVYGRRASSIEPLVAEGAMGTLAFKDLIAGLTPPRGVWLMVPAATVDPLVGELAALMQPGDMLIDGGNSYYVDDLRRSEQLGKSGIHYVDVGTSGGVWGLERGYCLMIGGPDEAVKISRSHFSHPCPGSFQHRTHTWARGSTRHR